MPDAGFHEVRFPLDIALGSRGGPERRTDVVALGSGHEERNSRWADSRRAYNAGYGVKSLDDLHAVVAFFEERRGRLYGFRWKDHADFRSCPPSATPTALDQSIGVGDGTRATFPLVKQYGDLGPFDGTLSFSSPSTVRPRPSAPPCSSTRRPASSPSSLATFPLTAPLSPPVSSSTYPSASIATNSR